MLLGALRLDDAVIELADNNRVQEIVLILSLRAGLAEDDALPLMIGAPEQPAALLCRAAGLGLNGYSAVLRMRRRTQMVNLERPAALLHAYLRLGAVSATELTSHMPTRRAGSGG